MSKSNDQTFTIPLNSLSILDNKLKSLNKRAEKLGCPVVGYTVVSEKEIPAPGYEKIAAELSTGLYPKIQVVEIALNGEGPKINGWTFVGTLDHTTLPGSVIVKTVPGESVPSSYFQHDATCAHCGKKRLRNETFVLRHDNGHHTHVGRQCLRDFFGHDIARIVSYLTSVGTLSSSLDDSDGWGGGGRSDYVFDHNEVLAATAAVIRKHGWVARSSTSDNTPTATLVLSIFCPHYEPGSSAARAHREWLETLDYSGCNEEAEAARQWLKQQNGNNEYMHNLHTIDAARCVSTRLFGFWCSLMAAYQRDQERLRLAKADKKSNEHFGTAGDKFNTNVTVVSIKNTQGYYGTVGIVKMLDDEGRTLVWFANGKHDLKEGQKFSIKGTVKKHDEYNNWKQTVVTRVKVIDVIT